jgi:hypothetical protein
MTHAKSKEQTHVGIDENMIVQYEKHSFIGLISWYVKVKSDSLGKDLVIFTSENYDKIYINGKECVIK